MIIGAILHTYHFERNTYDDNTPGIYAAFDVGTYCAPSFGVYKNSVGSVSLLAGCAIPIHRNFRVFAGALSGYGRNGSGVIPAIIPAFVLPVSQNANMVLNLGLKANKQSANMLNFAIEFKF